MKANRRSHCIPCPSLEPLEARIAPAIVTGTLPLASLDQSHGIKITGPSDGKVGYSVSSAGDINGDGLPDFVVTAPFANHAGGEVYIIYGQPGLTAPGTLALSSIDGGDGTLGFAIKDLGIAHFAGSSVSPAGDVNGDGIGDLIIGAPNGTAAGVAYVIFGQKGVRPAVLTVFNSGAPSDLNGANGFQIVGEGSGDKVGTSVSAGDVNGDGLSDLIIGAPGRNSSTGSVYVVFGQTSFPSVLNLSSLNGTNGLTINGTANGDLVGSSVSSMGDVDHDGTADFLVGAPGATSNAGAAYLIEGARQFSSASVSIDTVALFKATGAAAGDQVGTSVSGAGDLDADGTPDVLIGAPGVNNGAGAAYVFSGPTHGHIYSSFFSLAGASNIAGESAGDKLGTSVTQAGDVNGDGYQDLIVGAPGASSSTGASYVLFGKTGGLTGTIAASSLTGVNGFKISGATGNDASGSSVSGIQDVNGDGYADLLVGAPGAVNGSAGSAYVIYGGPSGLGVGHVSVNIVNGVGQFNDVDGDLVTVKLKTAIHASNFNLLVKSSGTTTTSQLLGLELGSEFEGSDLSITVKKAPGGDGRVNVGFIDAHGVDLGAVTVMGDLGKIVAGSGGTKPALKSLTVDSLGAFGGTTEDTGSDHTSTLTGSVGPVKILGDVRDAIFDVFPTATAGSGRIASLTLGGSIVGGRFNALGQINAAFMGPVQIGGSIVGGSGLDSGQLGAGSFSTITLGGSLIGGSGFFSGAIFSGAIGLAPSGIGAVGAVKIGGGLQGGSGGDSGELYGQIFSTVSISGSLTGGAGASSGTLLGATSSTITVGGSLQGGTGNHSGTVEVGLMGNITIHGDQIGGGGINSASILSNVSNGKIGKVFIGGSQIGGAAAQSAYINATGTNGSIAGVTIAGDAVGGLANSSGGILAVGSIGPVVIKGSVVGQEGAPYTIRGGGALTGATSLAIASLTVNGNFEHALVLGGYGQFNASVNGHAQIGAITVGRDWIASSVLAGVAATDSFNFIGNGFDKLIQAGASTAISSIASITIKGHASGSPDPGDHFGIEAQQIGAVTIGGTKLPLAAGKANDTAGFAIGTTPDFVIREVAP